MTRQKDQKKLGTWNHDKSGINVDYFIRHTTFYATVLGEELSAPEADVLRAKVMDKLEHWMQMDWHAVMQVQVEDHEGDTYREEPEGDGLYCKIKRFYLSRSPAGNVMEVDWDVDEAHRKAKMKRRGSEGYRGRDDGLQLARLPLGAPYKLSEGNWLLDYSEETWRACEEIIKALGKMKKQLRDLVKTRAGIAKLAAGGSKYLMLGDGKAK